MSFKEQAEQLSEELSVIKSCLLSLALAIEEGKIDGVVEEIQYTLGHVKRVADLEKKMLIKSVELIK